MGFAGNAKYGSDYHYAAKSVKLGEENRPIFWYKPTGSQTYRVIDAQLNVTDVSADQLPQVESVEVGPTPVGVNTPKVTP